MPGWINGLVMGAKTRTAALLNSHDMPQMFTKNTISISVNKLLFEGANMAYSKP